MNSPRRAERTFKLFMSIGVFLLFCIVGLATYFILNPPPPIKFTPPEIWREPYNVSADRQFSI